MRIRRKTAVVVQTHQVTTVHLTRQSIRARCGTCCAEALMLTPDEAAALAQSTARDIYRRVEAGELHSIETDDGSLRLCVNSLGETTSGSAGGTSQLLIDERDHTVERRFVAVAPVLCSHSHRGFSPVVKTRGEYQEPFQRFRRLLLNLPQESKPLKRFQVFVQRVITGLKPRCE